MIVIFSTKACTSYVEEEATRMHAHLMWTKRRKSLHYSNSQHEGMQVLCGRRGEKSLHDVDCQHEGMEFSCGRRGDGHSSVSETHFCTTPSSTGHNVRLLWAGATWIIPRMSMKTCYDLPPSTPHQRGNNSSTKRSSVIGASHDTLPASRQLLVWILREAGRLVPEQMVCPLCKE